MKKRSFQISRIFLVYLVSNLLLIVIPMTAAIVHNRQLQELMDSSTSAANDMLAQQLQLVIDYEMTEMESLYSTALQDKEGSISSYLYRDEIMTSEDHYAGVELIKELHAIRQPSDFLYDFYIWFPANHSIITPTMRLEDSLFYRSLISVNGMEYTDWTEAMSSSSSHVFSSLGEGYYNWGRDAASFRSDNVYYLCRMLPLTADNNVNPVMVFILKTAAFENLLDSITENIDSTMLIQSDIQGQIMRFPAEGEIVGTCYRYDSSVSTLHYEIYLDNYIVEEEHQKASRLSFLLTLVVACVGCITAVTLAWRNYRPIQELGNRFLSADVPADKRARVSNELEQVHDVFSRILSSNLLVEQELEKMRPVYIHQFLYNLLIGAQTYKEGSAEQYGIHQTGGSWIVAMLSIYDYGDFDYEGSEQQLVHAMIQNVTDELFEGKAETYYVYTVDGVIYLILNLYPDYASSSSITLLKEIHSFFKSRLKIDICFALSEPTADLYDLFTACTQARLVYGTMKWDASASVYPYSSVPCKELNSVAFSTNDEIRLMNTIRTGNEEQVEKLITEILHNNFRNNTLNRENIRILVMNLYCALQRCAQQFGCELGESTENMMKMIKTIPSEEKIIACFTELSLGLTRTISAHKPGKNQILVQQVQKLVEEQYKNPDLSVALLAEQLGISASYLSKLFKEISNTNVSDYIHKFRIERAKELMSDSNLTLGTIAEECGYLSDINFNRVFKRIEGVPPGAWRNAHFS